MDTPATLARRLADGLAELKARGPQDIDPEEAGRLADLAQALSDRFAAMSAHERRLLHTADSGFASSGQWVDQAIAKQDQTIHHVARAARVVAGWLGPDGAEAERVFLMRGHIRAWAHRWRTEDKGPAQVDHDPGFVAFATDCLQQAGIDGDYPAIIGQALLKEWRTTR